MGERLLILDEEVVPAPAVPTVVGKLGMPLNGARSGIRVVSSSVDKLAHQFYDFGALPAVISAVQ